MKHLAPLKFIQTMQPSLVDAPPEGDGWIHEIKQDGYRTQLLVHAGRTQAFTRNGFDWTDKYQPVVEAARRLPCTSAIIDGEIVVQKEGGVSDFHALRRAITAEPHRLVFFAFDLLQLDGRDLRSDPLEKRRDMLRKLIADAAAPAIHFSDDIEGQGAEFLRAAAGMGLEGIVSKKKSSRYSSGRTTQWLKTKCWTAGEFEVIGVERDQNGVPFVLLADADGYRGAAYVSLPEDLREFFWRFVETRQAAQPAVRELRKKRAQWLQPGLVANVRHLRGSDKLRHASVTGLKLAA